MKDSIEKIVNKLNTSIQVGELELYDMYKICLQ